MKNIYKYIKESLLDDEDDLIDNDSVISRIAVEKYLADHYKLFKPEIIYRPDGMFVVNCEDVILRSTAPAITNGAFEWGTVYNFIITNNPNITSLKGSPRQVKGQFSLWECSKLTSLKDGPEVVNSYDISNCDKLKNLKYIASSIRSLNVEGCSNLTTVGDCPEVVNTLIFTNLTKLTNLKGCPKRVEDLFQLRRCISLKDLKGCPEEVGELMLIKCPVLGELTGAPKKVKKFICKWCSSLKNLKGCPDSPFYSFENNKELETIEGLPINKNNEPFIELIDCRNLRDVSPLKGFRSIKNLDLSMCEKLTEIDRHIKNISSTLLLPHALREKWNSKFK